MAEKTVLCGELRASRCPGFYRLVLHALLHLRLQHRYDYENFSVQQQYGSQNMSEQAQGDLLQTQSQDDEQARRDPLPLEWPRGKV